MKLAIFDMDGTLYNTNDVNYFAYKEALEKYNISIDYEYYCNYCNGRQYSVFIPPLVNGDKDKIKYIQLFKHQRMLNRIYFYLFIILVILTIFSY